MAQPSFEVGEMDPITCWEELPSHMAKRVDTEVGGGGLQPFLATICHRQKVGGAQPLLTGACSL